MSSNEKVGMKKYTFALFALAATLAIAPAAFGDTFSFYYSGPSESAVGTLTGTEIGTSGDYQITSGTVTITGVFAGIGGIDNNSGDWAAFGADNELYYVNGYGPYATYLDHGGLLFSTTNGLNNIWAGDNNYLSPSYSLSGPWVDYPGTLSVTDLGKDVGQGGAVPDGGVTLVLLGSALVGLETLRRKFRA
jgi:hypothetical protein